jgi:hypothetical protein
MDKLPDYLLIVTFVVSCLTAVVGFYHSTSRNRLPILFFALIGCGGTFYSSLQSLNDKKLEQLIYDAHIDGGPAVPHIELGLTDDRFRWVFNVYNSSPDFTLHDIVVYGSMVSDDTRFVYSDRKPRAILYEHFLQPNGILNTNLIYRELPIDSISREARFNFLMSCKNGLFFEQMIIRIVNNKCYYVFQVQKDNHIIYQSEVPPGFLFPFEGALVFQNPYERFIIGTKEQEERIWKESDNYLPVQPIPAK